MKINIRELIEDLSTSLNENIKVEDIVIHTPGISNALIFQIRNDYLYKIYNSCSDYNNSKSFFECYAGNKNFQNVVFKNDKNEALCLTYLKGDLMYGKEGDYSFIIQNLYDIVKDYKEYTNNDVEKYNYGKNSWKEFLENNINYNYLDIIDKDIIRDNLEIIDKYTIKNYMLHGDFGSHNFIINENVVKVIDPCTFIGDKLYDFYCGIFSDPIIFEKSNVNSILNFFEEYDMEYKKALLVICFIYRMLIAVKYNYYKNVNVYYDWYDNIKKN